MAIESFADEKESSFGPLPGRRRATHEVTRDLVRVPDVLVNAYLFGEPGAESGEWALIDAGLGDARETIVRAAEGRFGRNSRPAGILLTHGHFDHVGSVKSLADHWDCKVYAHPDEWPYLTGRIPYPPADPTVGGGLMSRLSGWYPRGPIDLGDRLERLPDDGSVPGMPDWKWIHTPGHTPGHVSFFRKRDRMLVVGDAFVTAKQESAIGVATQYRKVHGPPAYLTTNWSDAWDSVRRLAQLRPEIAATGHGVPMHGEELRGQLDELVRDFDRIAIPDKGRYVRLPAIADEHGVHYVPPEPQSFGDRAKRGLGWAALAGAAWWAWRRLAAD